MNLKQSAKGLLLLATFNFSACAVDKNEYITKQMEQVKSDPRDRAALLRIEDEMASYYYANRVHAAAALGMIGLMHKDLGPEMLDALIKGLSDRQQSVRRASAAALLDIAQPATTRAIPELVKCLDEGDTDVAWFAAMAIGSYGQLAKEAVPALVKSLEKTLDVSTFNLISEKAADALGSIGDPIARPVLIRASESSNERTRDAAKKALTKLANAS